MRRSPRLPPRYARSTPPRCSGLHSFQSQVSFDGTGLPNVPLVRLPTMAAGAYCAPGYGQRNFAGMYSGIESSQRLSVSMRLRLPSAFMMKIWPYCWKVLS
jgi:hypothetical protein